MKTSLAAIATLALFAGIGSLPAHAGDVEISNAWVRGTVAGQKATGAFMDITSAKGGALVGASAPGILTQVHEMSMENGVMRMQEAKRVELPAGKTVSLKPGGYHVMLMDLKKPLSRGEVLPITLTIQGADGKTEKVEVKAEVRALTAMPAMDHHH